MIPIYIQRLSPTAKLPTRATEGAAGYDLYVNQDAEIPPGYIAKLKLGIAMEIDPKFFVYVRPRSGLATNHGIDLCSSGIVDSDYRGEVHMPVINHGDKTFSVKTGDRIGQMVVLPVPDTKIIEVDSLTETARGSGGFGSTGSK